MLRGKNLRGRHQRRLVAVLDGYQHGLQGHNRLAGSDIALQQAPHRDGLRMSATISPSVRFCAAVGMKRQHLADGFAHLVVRCKRDARPLAHAAAFQFQPELEIEQFLEDQAAGEPAWPTPAVAPAEVPSGG